MTTAIVHRTKDGAFLAVDSQATRCDGAKTLTTKVFENEDTIFAFSGDARLLNVFTKADIPPGVGLSAYDYANKLITTITKTASDDNYICGTVLLIKNGVPVVVCEDFASEIKEGEIYAIGSGGDYAKGALKILLQQEGVNIKDAMIKSVETASTFDAYTNSEIQVFYQENPNANSENHVQKFKFEVKSVENGEFSGIFSTDDFDGNWDIMTVDAMDDMCSQVNVQKVSVLSLFEHKGHMLTGYITYLKRYSDTVKQKNWLFGKGKIDISTDLGSSVYQKLKDGVITGLSVGGYVRQFISDNSYSKDGGARYVRYITRFDLKEVSFCLNPVNKNARVLEVKSKDANQNDLSFSCRKEAEEYLRDSGLSRSQATSIYSAIKANAIQNLPQQGNLVEVENNQGNLDNELSELKLKNAQLIKDNQNLVLANKKLEQSITKLLKLK